MADVTLRIVAQKIAARKMEAARATRALARLKTALVEKRAIVAARLRAEGKRQEQAARVARTLVRTTAAGRNSRPWHRDHHHRRRARDARPAMEVQTVLPVGARIGHITEAKTVPMAVAKTGLITARKIAHTVLLAAAKNAGMGRGIPERPDGLMAAGDLVPS